ncbi:hypothetical protein CHS0354_005654 [Potamilus streckersoni]|uniref:Uncharacterized protein n=1 Tax=Potamilus streckersoni TaxID=2493646 RepID=A0AAE0S0S8_9BIVA|nr:hypothetical protein CHS0354_005654 [Potamilus streckersoni]
MGKVPYLNIAKCFDIQFYRGRSFTYSCDIIWFTLLGATFSVKNPLSNGCHSLPVRQPKMFHRYLLLGDDGDRSSTKPSGKQHKTDIL